MAAGELSDAEVFGQRELSDAEVFSRPALLNPSIAAQGARAQEAQGALRTTAEFMSSRDPGIDYRMGVRNAAFRAYFSRMDNEAEKAQFLDKTIGKGNWGQDSFGAYFLQPKGLKRLGIQSDMPVSIDEQKATAYDIADVAGSAPAIAGATGYGLAASGLGFVPGASMAALGAAGGKALDEIIKNLAGDQVKTAGEVGTEIGKEAAAAGAGEAVVRGLAPVARFALGPGAARMTPEKAALAASATEQGFHVRPGSVTDAPILARWEGMVRQIFGDLYQPRNRAAAEAGIERLSSAAGPRVTKEEAGEAVRLSLIKQRVNFGEAMATRYKEIDDLVGNNPIIPTDPLKQRAGELLARMPKTADGKVIGGKDAFIKDIMNMGDAMTVTQAQRLRTMLREASESPDLVPDVAMHEARELKKAVEQSFEAAKKLSGEGVEARAVNMLRTVDASYAKGIQQFDKPVVTAIARDASRTGSVPADEVVDYLIKPERVVRLRQVKNAVSEEAWGKVKSAHAQDLVSTISRGTDDPLKTIFDGRVFRDTLNKYGREALEEVHGKQWVDDAYSFANALMLADKKATMSGGIVAANVALHPIVNLPRLVWIRALAKAIEQPGTFKYLTEGFKVGPGTQAGAAVISRFLSQAVALSEDQTGSARFTVTEQQPQQ